MRRPMMADAMSSARSNEAFLQFFREVQPVRQLYMMGGFAEDAWLAKSISPDRSDVDFLVEADAWDSARAGLEGVGLTFEALVGGPRGEPLAYVSRDRGFPVEVWLADREPQGYAIVLPGEARLFKLRLPSDCFHGHEATLDGVGVRTVSPLALAVLRAASAQTRGDAAKRVNDRQVANRITTELLRNHAGSEVIPEITELPKPGA
jgi:hypothetical protein